MDRGRARTSFPFDRERVERAELHLVIMLARMLRIEIGDAIDTEDHGLPHPGRTCRCRFLSAASTIHGYRSDQL